MCCKYVGWSMRLLRLTMVQREGTLWVAWAVAALSSNTLGDRLVLCRRSDCLGMYLHVTVRVAALLGSSLVPGQTQFSLQAGCERLHVPRSCASACGCPGLVL